MKKISLQTTIDAARHYLAPTEVDCVVYHYPCSDGAGAALSAWMALGDKASYEQRCYEEHFNEDKLRDKKVVLLDCSFKQEQLHKIRAIASKIMILDHHDSAMKELGSEPGCFFNMQHSGAVLAWHYFHGVDQQAPLLIQLIEDRDLWRWSQRELSEPLFYALVARHPDINFKQYEQYLNATKLTELIDYGKTLTAANNAWCAQTARQAELKTFRLPGTAKTFSVMAQPLESDKLVSELAEYLYVRNNVDFVVFWYPLDNGQYKLSFRADKDYINLGEIAKGLGGGGHPKAAGAVVNDPEELFI